MPLLCANRLRLSTAWAVRLWPAVMSVWVAADEVDVFMGGMQLALFCCGSDAGGSGLD